eukprot:TRINITY_DN3870_c0_g6_i1.p1 TRINITY_DN3870_c0_g6~~TRINITY_DN3870_c0_g6_i1.p1  ORF type:complete len:149 (+),score=26.03 TRINITY_DN3870_c0_g6_i1:101-547(+)
MQVPTWRENYQEPVLLRNVFVYDGIPYSTILTEKTLTWTRADKKAAREHVIWIRQVVGILECHNKIGFCVYFMLGKRKKSHGSRRFRFAIFEVKEKEFSDIKRMGVHVEKAGRILQKDTRGKKASDYDKSSWWEGESPVYLEGCEATF